LLFKKYQLKQIPFGEEMTPPYPTEFERRLRRAYSTQRRSAIKRGIPFLFTFEQWSEWWLTDDRWSRRGRKAGQLQMGRKSDSGPYSPDNVECATKEQKQKAQLIGLWALPPEKRAEAYRKAGLARRGEKHWQAKPVVTPLGKFPTITAAAKAHGIAQPSGSTLARERRDGWRYLDDPAQSGGHRRHVALSSH
jgi:hypothetical protein